MTYLKNKKISLAIILTLFFGFFLGFNNGSVSAVSECSLTVYDNLSNWIELPTSCSLPLSSYHYIKVSGGSGSVVSLRVGPSTSDIRFNLLSMPTDFDIRAVTLEDNFKFYSYGVQSVSSGTTIVLFDSFDSGPSGTLSITENGTFDVTDYASVSVDVDQNVTEIIEDPISNDFQKVFFEIVKNIIPAFGILLVVWFGIDMLSSLIFGRGR